MLSPYGRYVLQKACWYLIAFYVAISLNFLLPRLIPGNPVAVIVNQLAQGGAQSETVQRLYTTFMEEFGLNRPLGYQYIEYLGNVLTGDLGTSFTLYPGKVRDLIRRALPWSLALQIPAILTAWIIGNVLGAISAYKGGKFDRRFFTAALFFSTIPYYSFAIILVYVLAVKFPVFPTAGGYSFGSIPGLSWHFLVDVLHHYTLPFLSMVVVGIGGQAIGMRQMAIYELGTDYINYAKSLGISDRILIRYVFHNGMLPQITGLALSFGTMMGGALVTESVFSYPGIGSLLFTGIRQNDYPLLQGITLIISLAVLLANFLVEIAYGYIDPRIKASQQGER